MSDEAAVPRAMEVESVELAGGQWARVALRAVAHAWDETRVELVVPRRDLARWQPGTVYALSLTPA